MKHFAIFFLLICFSLHAYAQKSKALEGLVDQIVYSYLEDEGNKGLVVGIIDEGYHYHYSYGQLSAKDSNAPDSSTLFEIGGLSKVFTAHLILQLAKDKAISLDSSIIHFLPDSIQNIHLNSISFNDILAHQSALPRKPYNLSINQSDKDDPYADYSLEDLYSFLQFYKPNPPKKSFWDLFKRKPKTNFKYSNIGYGLLGHLAEDISQKSYEDLLEMYINRPYNLRLKITDPDIKGLAQGHQFNGQEIISRSYLSMYGSSGLAANAKDLLKYAEINLKAEETIFEELQKLRGNTNFKNLSIAAAWHVFMQAKKPYAHTHSGATGGYSCYLAFIKESQTAVVILSNSANRVDDIGIDILQLLNR